MVFYFSGTGNSQLAAKQIAAELGDELVFINDCLKKGEKKTFHSERPLVFAAPIYAWRVPKVVEQWIREMKFEGSRDAYFVLTLSLIHIDDLMQFQFSSHHDISLPYFTL